MPRIDVVAVTFFCVLLFPFCCCSFKMRKFFFFSSSFHYYCQFAVDAVAMIMTECHRFSEHKTSPVGIGFGILISILICFRLLSLAFIWIVSCFQILEVYMRFYGQNCAHFSPFFRLTRVVEHFISFFCILSYFLVVFLFTFAFIWYDFVLCPRLDQFLKCCDIFFFFVFHLWFLFIGIDIYVLYFTSICRYCRT